MLQDIAIWWRAGRRRKMSARWLVRMHGPDAFRWRGHFETWRQADPENARTYDRQLGIWGVARGLGSAEAAPRRERSVLPYAIAASVALVAVGLSAVALRFPRAAAPVEIVTNDAGPRTVRLADGSSVMLAKGSALEVALDRNIRRLALTRGRMRLQLQTETRPAELRAGSVLVRTTAASVDVTLAGGLTRVILLGGEVQLARYDGTGQGGGVSLKPGELVDVGKTPEPITPRRAHAADLDWPRAMISFDDAPLSGVLADANALSMTRIALADPELGQKRVTGAYHMGDNEGLARSLSASLGLSVARTADGEILLRRGAE